MICLLVITFSLLPERFREEVMDIDLKFYFCNLERCLLYMSLYFWYYSLDRKFLMPSMISWSRSPPHMPFFPQPLAYCHSHHPIDCHHHLYQAHDYNRNILHIIHHFSKAYFMQYIFRYSIIVMNIQILFTHATHWCRTSWLSTSPLIHIHAMLQAYISLYIFSDIHIFSDFSLFASFPAYILWYTRVL